MELGMGRKSSLVLLAVLLCVAIGSGYDYFYFVQQWSNSYCNLRPGQTCDKPVYQNFTIHGLWPQDKTGRILAFCSKAYPFDAGQITSIRRDLNTAWRNLRNLQANEAFWKTEWDKHGTCSLSIFDQFHYFQLAVELKNKFDFAKILKNAGVVPNDTHPYQLKKIQKAIARSIKFRPTIQCIKNRYKKHQIYQIYLCLDKFGRMKNCRIHDKNCAWEVYFPTVRTVFQPTAPIAEEALVRYPDIESFLTMAGQRNYHGKQSHFESDNAGKGGNKRRNPGDERDQFVIEPEDTVYRYLCPGRKIESIVGRGGYIVKQLRADTKSKIRIGETVSGCEERVVTIYSSSDETNLFEDTDNFVSPAQDALFRVHDRIVADESDGDEDFEESPVVAARLLVSSDQIGCVSGKGGQIIQNIRNESGAQIHILKDEHLPACALSTDELVQICGKASAVKKALHQIASRLHDNPSRSQHLLTSALPNPYPSVGDPLMGPAAGAPITGLAPLVGTHGQYKADAGDSPRSFYSAPRHGASSKEF